MPVLRMLRIICLGYYAGQKTCFPKSCDSSLLACLCSAVESELAHGLMASGHRPPQCKQMHQQMQISANKCIREWLKLAALEADSMSGQQAVAGIVNGSRGRHTWYE